MYQQPKFLLQTRHLL